MMWLPLLRAIIAVYIASTGNIFPLHVDAADYCEPDAGTDSNPRMWHVHFFSVPVFAENRIFCSALLYMSNNPSKTDGAGSIFFRKL